MRKQFILLVEDEFIIQEKNKRILERRGYTIRQAYTLAEARSIIADQLPRAIILDISLPDGNGLDFLRELRKTSNIPVLMLTSMGTPEDIIRGLKSGGDDYLPKPYDLAIFLTRLEALMRRASMIPEMLELGPLILEPASGRALLYGEDMVLSLKEYTLLQHFVLHLGETLSAEYLYEKVWGLTAPDGDKALKNMVYRLRKKLEDSGYTISAERNEGYILEEQ